MNALVGLLLIPWTTILRGLALSLLWRWYVVDTFHVAPLSIPAALGIAVIVTMLTFQPPPGPKNTGLAEKAIGAILTSAFGLGLGWIYKLFL